ncbi:MAG: hypothetical protein JRI23_22065, partial [Deltaproteobacteria bacterium]|nr:hypothetical protein [Deltaproteobacteria bacterium]MBW2534645.1 hypothetical protein [Deltaproteobacteria bacterium]
GQGGDAGGATVDDGLLPRLDNFRVTESATDRVYFDSSEPIAASTVTGFTVSGKTITEVVVNGRQLTDHYFTIGSAFDFWDNNTIRYEGGSDLRDLEGNALHPFELHYVRNEIPEPENPASGHRYVTTAATGGGDGLTEATAWTLPEAVDSAAAGQTVWIKAGLYDDPPELIVSGSGTDGAPLKFVGYRDTPGDITSMYFDYAPGVLPDPAEMPLIRGAAQGTGTAFRIDGKSNIIVRNLQISAHHYNLLCVGSASHIIADRIVSTPAEGPLSFHDEAITESRIINSIAIDAGMSNIRYYGTFGLLDNNQSYGDLQTSDATDYYVTVRNRNNILRNLHLERAENNDHGGHGFSIKAVDVPTEYNLIEKSVAININQSIEVRHHEVQHNVFRDLEVYSDGMSSTWGVKGIVFTGGSYNVLDRIHHRNGWDAISFRGTTEDPDGDTAGHDNVIKNSVFENVGSFIYASDVLGKAAWGNKIINCTVNGATSLQVVVSATFHHDNEVINTNLTNVGRVTHSGHDGPFVATYRNSNFFNFGDPELVLEDGQKVDCTSEDPQYVDADGGDLRLLPSSAVADAGMDVLEIRYDFDGKQRHDGHYSIGAFEVDQAR